MSIDNIPLLPLRDVVVYPHMVIPLFVGRARSIKALEAAMTSGKKVLLVTQKDAVTDNPDESDLYSIGTISNVMQLLKLPDGTVKVLVEGIQRGQIKEFVQRDPFFLVSIESIDTTGLNDREQEVLLRSLVSQFEHYVKLNKKVPQEIMNSLQGIDEPIRLVDTIAAHMSLKITEKQSVIEIQNLRDRINHLMLLLESEIDLLQVEKRIHGQVKKQMEKSQREYYLNEKIKAIRDELGKLGDGSGGNELDLLKEKIEKAGMPKEAKEKAMSEWSKLNMMSAMSAEATVSRNYIDWMISIPWKKRSRVSHNIKQAEQVLDKEHFGLDKVKERILEYLAVHKRINKVKGPILCLVGPPGVGKTSLGRSIANATARKYLRISLGGVRDEAEIRGHRRTYIGAMPGKILQKLSKVGVCNPMILLDEIDKMAMDFRGDPASALLEVLDPEQNTAFNDHYLEVDYDLSDIMFVATSNSLDIPEPLLDRMEIIRLAGYTEDEKSNIALNYLVPKQIKDNGLKESEVIISADIILEIIRYYTREAGVRALDREISKICRKVVKDILLDSKLKCIEITPKNLEEYLGVRKYRFGEITEEDRVGQVVGLAWTQVGGDILTIEATTTSGKGKVIRTGKLGDVMQESIQAALTVVRSRANILGIESDFYEKKDIHIHVPEGATPKDGPSAGIGMCTAMVSSLTNIPVRRDFAMTGEITLRGEVLPIGGLKEKLLAAKRAGILHVIIPDDNKRDLKELPENITSDLVIHPVKWIDEVLQLALAELPVPIEVAGGDAKTSSSDKDDCNSSDQIAH